MRVGIVTTSYPRAPDDPSGSFVAGHAQWLASAGHEVEVIAAGTERDHDQVMDGAVRVTRVSTGTSRLFYRGGAPEALGDAIGSLSSVRRWADATAFTAALAAAVAPRIRRWDVAFAHWLVPCASVTAAVGARTPLVAIAHSGDVHTLRRLRAIGPVARLLSRRNVRLAFVTEQLRGLFLSAAAPRTRERLAARSIVCPMGIDTARFRRAAAVTDKTEPPTVLFLGRLVPVKGVDTLIAAAAHLRHPARVCIAGAGPERRRLAAFAATHRNVELIGEVRGEARDRLLASASVLVMPSVVVEHERSEGLPVAVVEAMAAGVPVVASGVGGLLELPEGALSIVSPNEPRVLAAAIDDVLEDTGHAAALAQKGWAFAGTRDWSEVGPTLFDLVG